MTSVFSCRACEESPRGNCGAHDTITLPREVVVELEKRLEAVSIERHKSRRHPRPWGLCDEGTCLIDHAALAALKAKLEEK